MISYWFIIIVILLLQINFNSKWEKSRNFIFIMIILFLFAALRGNGEGDYFNYLNYSTSIQHFDDVMNFNFPMEIGFRLISFISNTLKFNSQFVIMSMNAISLFCIYNFLKWHSPDFCYSIILFFPIFLQYDMHAARTAVAISLCTIAYHYLLDNNLKKYFLYILFAMCFHKTAIIFVLAFFVRKINIGFNLSIILIGMLCVFTLLFDFDNIIINALKAIGFQSYANAYASYANSEQFGYAFNLFDPRFIMIIAIFVFTKFCMDKNSKCEIITSNLLLINIILILVLRQHTVMALRLSYYFNIYTIIAIPSAIQHIQGKANQLTYKVIIAMLYIIYIAFILREYVPYKLFF